MREHPDAPAPACAPGDRATARRGAVRRWLRIVARTAHILSGGVLVGGHLLAVAPDPLRPWLYGTLTSGALLWATDLGQGLGYLREVRALTVLLKIALVAAAAVAWEARVPLLVAVVLVSGVVSHMPGRYRYWVLGRGPRRDDAPEARAGLG
jgi:hypothetical protein